MKRSYARTDAQLRPIKLTRHFTKHAEGSVLIEVGDTKVLCNASVAETVPGFLRGSNQGWVTAEYGMIPRSTHSRMKREAASKQSGRTIEIQRLIGRSLRAGVDLAAMGEMSITVDCDVIQADGGTRTAAITGASVALMDAFNGLVAEGKLKTNPMQQLIAAVSVGIVEGQVVLDLDYAEDSQAETDMNIVMTETCGFVEIQGTAEGQSFSDDELVKLIAHAKIGIAQLVTIQKDALNS